MAGRSLDRNASGHWLPSAADQPARAKKKVDLPGGPVVDECRVGGCGSVGIGPRPQPGMVRVAGSKDGALVHWYCANRCAGIARARADLRSVSTSGGGLRA
ncbi:hypothetical protein [Streptomyces sp. NPDC088794]|uniref:hypothetical protein n=1 Tax=Streptomyces sp. NPDC088794 TaxID=3365902 RepID=UPI0037FB4491